MSFENGIVNLHPYALTVFTRINNGRPDGDLEEMAEELSGGKVMYAYIQVTDPNTQLPKNVLVNWVSRPSLLPTLVTMVQILVWVY